MTTHTTSGGGITHWSPTQRFCALSPRVIAAAQTRIEGTWAAYIDAVPGERHANEWEAVLERGTKLDEDVARVIFPRIDLPYAR